VRGAWLHVIGDALGLTGAIVAGILIMLFGLDRRDSLISVHRIADRVEFMI